LKGKIDERFIKKGGRIKTRIRSEKGGSKPSRRTSLNIMNKEKGDNGDIRRASPRTLSTAGAKKGRLGAERKYAESKREGGEA